MLENCRWLLYASRFYGCHPHTIRERSVTVAARFNPLMFYSLLACGVYCLAAYHADGSIQCVSSGAMIVGCALQQINRYSRGSYMIATTVLSCLRHLEFERAVAAARKFDDLTRHRRRDVDKQAHHRAQWLALLGVHVAWTLFGTYAHYAVDGKVPWLTVLLQAITRAAFSTQIAKFCFLFDALRRKFRLVNDMCRESPGAVTSFVQRVTVPGVVVGANAGATGLHGEDLTILHLQRLHRCLSDATKYLNSHYNPQLIFWFTCMIIDILTYVFLCIYTRSNPKMVVLQCAMLLYISVQMVTIGGICQLTCDQANALARMVFSAETSIFRHSEFSTEAIELGVYLRVHPLRIRVFGLFNVNNHFTFLVFAVTLMYVILASSIH